MLTRCPICKKKVHPPEKGDGNPAPSSYPFCSERCKLIDLGRWLDGKYQIPVVGDALDEAPEEQ